MKLKKMRLATVMSCIMPVMASAYDTQVVWETLGNDANTYTQRITVKGDMSFDKLGFNIFKRGMTPVNPADTITELIPGYFTLSSSRFVPGADSVAVDIVTRGSFGNIAYAPDGWHRIERDGSTSKVDYQCKLLTRPEQWRVPGAPDQMPYGDEVYDINERINGGKLGIYDVIPSYKSVDIQPGTSKLPLKKAVRIAPTDKAEGYTITISNDSMIVTAADERTADMAIRSFEALVLTHAGHELPNAQITDYPDFEYRGLMIDVCRNFQPIETLKNFVDYMSQYRMNVLHLHFIDDEAWRIEIEALPELTEFAGRRGYSPNESLCLYQLYSGDGDPNSTDGASNGYYTRQQFIDFLKYAYDRGIYVLPEMESPGHARAAVKAMEKRYRDTGDDTYRLIHDGDTSTYTSAQAYHDNVMNPALPGPYKFMEVIFDAFKSMYDEAGVPLLAIHIGGDEVANGAWSGSEIAQKLIEEKGLNGQTGLHGYFVEAIAQMLAEKGIPMSGWQEVAVGHNDRYNKEISPLTYSVNCWTQSSEDPAKSVTARALMAGFPIILSNVDYFYLDMCYNHHPNENGLKWGGVVDEFKSLHGYPKQMCPIDPADAPGKVVGLSGQIFAETLRSPQMLELYLFPKMLGLVERSWNSEPTYNDADFNAVIETYEIPRWEATGRNYHLRQPGIKSENGQILMNSPYQDAVIRYTTDGSEPTIESPEYTDPIDAADIKEVRARLYHGTKESLVSILYL